MEITVVKPPAIPIIINPSRPPSRLFFTTTTTTTTTKRSSSSSSSATATAICCSRADRSFSPLQPLLLPTSNRTIFIDIDYYQVLGIDRNNASSASAIHHAYQSKTSSAHPHPSFSVQARTARLLLLQAAYKTLCNPAARAEYDRTLNPLTTRATAVPWDTIPGALCLLLEAGQSQVVLRTARPLLLQCLPVLLEQDVQLVVKLAALHLISHEYGLLEKALNLLPSPQEKRASNLAPILNAQIYETLGKITPQIDETLEVVDPHYIIDILALPLEKEHQVKREEGLSHVHDILWIVGGGGDVAVGGGFTRKDFINEAFSHMTSVEQVELFAAKTSNIQESSEIYGVALAMVAQAFVSKKPHLVKDADNLFLQLQLTTITPLGAISNFTKIVDPKIDFALERGLCSLLVGDIDKCHSWLGIDNKNSPYRNSCILEFLKKSNLDNENDLLPGIWKQLETWLMEVVFPRFRDTRDVRFRLRDYYDDPIVLNYLKGMYGGGFRSLAIATAMAGVFLIMSGAAMIGLNSPGRSGLPFARKELNSGTMSIRDTSPPFTSRVPIQHNTEESLLQEMPKMDAEFAEDFIRKWHDIKSRVFGPYGCLEELHEVLDGCILKAWTKLATVTGRHSCFWEYTLLGISINNVTLSSDGHHAIVDVTIKEKATLLDGANFDNECYSDDTTYTTKYEMVFSKSGWKIMKVINTQPVK